jgi:hypothetical protein
MPTLRFLLDNSAIQAASGIQANPEANAAPRTSQSGWIASTLVALLFFANSAFAQGFPRVRIDYQLPQSSELTEIVKSTYALDPSGVQRNLRRLLSRKFKDGITIADAELFGFICDKTPTPSCSYSGKVIDQVDGAKESQTEGRRRELSINVNLRHPIDVQSLTYEVGIRYIN